MEKENTDFFTRSLDAVLLFLLLRVEFLKFYQITILKRKKKKIMIRETPSEFETKSSRKCLNTRISIFTDH